MKKIIFALISSIIIVSLAFAQDEWTRSPLSDLEFRCGVLDLAGEQVSAIEAAEVASEPIARLGSDVLLFGTLALSSNEIRVGTTVFTEQQFMQELIITCRNRANPTPTRGAVIATQIPVRTAAPIVSSWISCDMNLNNSQEQALCDEIGLPEGGFLEDGSIASAEDAQNAYDRGLFYITNGLYEAGFEECNSFLSLPGTQIIPFERARALMCRGWANFYLNDNQAARRDFLDALDSDREGAVEGLGSFSVIVGIRILNRNEIPATRIATPDESLLLSPTIAPQAQMTNSESMGSVSQSHTLIWEYLVVNYSQVGFDPIGEIVLADIEPYASELDELQREGFRGLNYYLNALGQQGWELVHINYISGSTYTVELFFKRPLG